MSASMVTEYETEEWFQLRDAVIREAKLICRHCQKRRAITAHHKTYDYGIICPKKYLLAVCALCHGFSIEK